MTYLSLSLIVTVCILPGKTSPSNLDFLKGTVHQMEKIQKSVDDVLSQMKGLKVELGDVGQASVQAVYNIQKSEENLMKVVAESWNRTIYALRQEPSSKHHEQEKEDPDSSSTETAAAIAPSPTLAQRTDEIQADSSADSNGTIERDGRNTSTSGVESGIVLKKSHVSVSCSSSRKRKAKGHHPKDCSELQLSGFTSSGLFQIYPYPTNQSDYVQVYCDLDTLGGGWTVIQRRGDYQVTRENFDRTWQDYEQGFGSVHNHFWIGLAALSSLTSSGEQELRIELTDWDRVEKDANYAYFRVSNSSDNYKIHVTDFAGNAGDSFTYHNGMSFTTKDKDNDLDKDINCAKKYGGGWWYRSCHQANLNGRYSESGKGKTKSYGTGVNWYTWHGYYYSLKKVEMKIRPRNFSLD